MTNNKFIDTRRVEFEELGRASRYAVAQFLREALLAKRPIEDWVVHAPGELERIATRITDTLSDYDAAVLAWAAGLIPSMRQLKDK